MDLRDFIVALERHGLLSRISERVHWRHDIGRMARAKRNEALLFEDIADYPACRLFTGGLGRLESFAVALGLEPDVGRATVIRTLRERFSNPVPPLLTANGRHPVQTQRGAEVNLFDLPVPWWHESDAGRYLGTWHLNITKSPVTGTRNVGVYRMQILSRNEATVSFSGQGDLARHVQEAEATAKPLPMAVAIGVSEMLMVAAAAAPPYGVDELALAGGLIGQPVELAPCETVDLEVPVSFEFLLEGILKPGVRVQDGPYFDYAGVQNVNPKAALFEVKAVRRREEPVFRGTSVGVPGAEDHQLFSLLAHLGLVDFHGRRSRHRVQAFLVKRRFFRLFQWAGRLGTVKRFLRRVPESR